MRRRGGWSEKAPNDILERQGTADVDNEETALIEEHFRRKLDSLGVDTENETVFIPSQIVAKWYGEAIGTRDLTVTREEMDVNLRRPPESPEIGWLVGRVPPTKTQDEGGSGGFFLLPFMKIKQSKRKRICICDKREWFEPSRRSRNARVLSPLGAEEKGGMHPCECPLSRQERPRTARG